MKCFNLLSLFGFGMAILILTIAASPDLSIRRGGGTSAPGTTYAFNSNQFSLVNSTNVHLSAGALTTNVSLYFGASSVMLKTNGAGLLTFTAPDGTNSLLETVATASLLLLSPASGATVNLGNVPSTYLSTVAATNLYAKGLTPNRAVYTTTNGKLAESLTTGDELGYVNGVTSAIQTQLNGKVANLGGLATNLTVEGALTNGQFLSPWQELVYADATNVVINATNGMAFHLLVTNTAFITITNIPNRLWTAWLDIEQDTNGTYAVTFDTPISFANDTPPTITTNAGRMDHIGLKSNSRGTNVSALVNQNFLP